MHCSACNKIYDLIHKSKVLGKTNRFYFYQYHQWNLFSQCKTTKFILLKAIKLPWRPQIVGAGCIEGVGTIPPPSPSVEEKWLQLCSWECTIFIPKLRLQQHHRRAFLQQCCTSIDCFSTGLPHKTVQVKGLQVIREWWHHFHTKAQAPSTPAESFSSTVLHK